MKATGDDIKSKLIHVKGLVQGVGFRPFVYRIAYKCSLNGWVENRNDGVHIKVEGSGEKIDVFLTLLKITAPPASNIENIYLIDSETECFNKFEIKKSENTSDEVTEVSPDIAVCAECLEDMQTQPNRIDYPFINCTNCGPRFTIIKDLPYDREKTTMSPFVMCADCRKEYTDIIDRRFHAQPVACNVCGPQYELYYEKKAIKDFREILPLTASVIDNGKIVAIKGTGGFHLACDAANDEAVKRLRLLKHRENKPFAVMFASIEEIRRNAEVNETEEKILQSWRRPIVLLFQRKNTEIAPSVGIGLKTIGSFLPYMPVHYLLFEKLKTKAIVLTSGNISDEPIVIDNEEAKQKLTAISDALLVYNRDIYNRTDDSVITVVNGKESIIRRSRGFVPNPVHLDLNVEGIVAAGAELKNCFCIGKGNQAIMSQHIGDMKNIETYNFYIESLARFKKIFRVKPELFVGDLHPDYLSTKFVNKVAGKKMFVQHHHAHIASCMAEHKLDEKVIGVSFDGTGYGTDGNIWGGEFLICDLSEFQRYAHFKYIPAPGGDKVTDEPWRMAVSYLYNIYGMDFLNLKLSFLKSIPRAKLDLLLIALDKKINCPLTSSAGRLFDAVSALNNICCYAGFEAEGPMRLESIIAKNNQEKYPFDIGNCISFKKTFQGILDDINHKTDISIISAKFHNTIIFIILEVVLKIRNETGLNKVALSGGTFQNRYLLENTEKVLEENKFEIFTHSKVPANDGGIALGQLAVAAKRRSMNCL
ncbi:MAG: carbamoyltransferase HypF [Bacteroidetes bacterium]|nr:carbamoyltransferase HypF [Bacteroidota bacterium]